MKKQKIEDIFSSIENFSSVPPPELWNKIEEKLDKPKKKKRTILWWSAAACLLLGLLIPSVLHFNSDAGFEKRNNGFIEKSVVLDENNKKTKKKTNPLQENNTEKKADVVENSSSAGAVNHLNNSQNNKTYKTRTSPTDNKNNSGISNAHPDTEKENANHALAEKTFAAGKQNSFNIFSDNTILKNKKTNENQAVAEKTFATGKQNSFNTFSDNTILKNKETNENQAVAEKTFSTGKQNQNSFNTFSDKQIPNSVFDEKTVSKNNGAIALHSLNSNSGTKKIIENEVSNEAIKTGSILAENIQKNNSAAANLLSKQDSVQLSELKNLEKGIAEVKTEKEKETKSVPESEKWSLEVFAGIANSENYGKQKTLGNINESKQTNSYGVKTNYRLNKKWAVSSGIKINELGQSVANVSYYSTNHTAASSFPTTSDYMNQNPTVIKPTITTNSSYVFVSKNTQNALKSSNFETGNIDQSLKYIEMPLEISYALFNKDKTSISLNTGGFVGKLISNNVTLNGNSIGDNPDASDFVYGSLLSSTLQYRLYKKTHIFVEPGMNYYVNPLSNQTFNQFQWSFNFGLNVSF